MNVSKVSRSVSRHLKTKTTTHKTRRELLVAGTEKNEFEKQKPDAIRHRLASSAPNTIEKANSIEVKMKNEFGVADMRSPKHSRFSLKRKKEKTWPNLDNEHMFLLGAYTGTSIIIIIIIIYSVCVRPFRIWR